MDVSLSEGVGNGYNAPRNPRALALGSRPSWRESRAVSFPLSGTSGDRLASLIEINRLLTAEVDLDYLLRLIVTTASQLVGAHEGSLLMVDPATQQLEFTLSLGAESDTLRTIRLNPGEGIAGWVVQEGKPALVPDVATDPRFSSKVDRKTGYETKSILAVPLQLQGKTIGVIEMLNPTTRDQFDEEDMELLSAFAAQAAVAVRNARLVAAITEEKGYLQAEIDQRYNILIGDSTPMQEAVRTAKRAAVSSSTVLLLGETGVGKEMFARSIHNWSPRAKRPFVAINCVALTDTLLESELFGHEKGAFTGAHQQKKGLLEVANGGTVFLDEIGDMKLELQAKLLRVLETRQFERVGGTHPIQTDIRILAATNQDLAEAMRNGRFRKDLYFRLNVISIHLPPLRDRRDDIPALANYFVGLHAREVKRPVMQLSPEAVELLKTSDWPGNVRELQNVIERAVVLSLGDEIGPNDLLLPTKGQMNVPLAPTLELPFHEAVLEHKKTIIEQAIAQEGGRKGKAAERLKLHPTYFSRLCKQLGIS